MPRCSSPATKPPFAGKVTAGRALSFGAAFLSTLWLAGCAAGPQSTPPAQAMTGPSQPPGSVYLGWRVFQDRCAFCHSPAATGTDKAPDLTVRVRQLGQRQFVDLVLRRYDWSLPASEARSEGAMRDALIDAIAQRQDKAMLMPAWEGEPRVDAHIIDLHAYLSARADGTQGPDRPGP